MPSRDAVLRRGGLIKSWQTMGDLPKALEFYEQVLRILKAALGPEHHAVAATLTNLGSLYQVCAGCCRPAAGQADNITAGHGQPAESP